MDSIIQELSSSVVFRTFVLVLAVWLLKVLWGRRKLYALSFKLPGPMALPILGNAIQLGSFSRHQEMIICLDDLKKKYGDICRVWMGPEICVVLSEAEDFECALLSKLTSWKGSSYDIIKTGMGPGLVTLSGDTWKRHRNIINPAYSMKTIRGYQHIHDLYAKTFVQGLEEICDKGYNDVTVYSLRYWGDTICHSLFDWETKFYEGNHDFILSMTPWSARMIHERIVKVWLLPTLTYRFTEHGKLFYDYISMYRGYYYEEIKKKVANYIEANPKPISDTKNKKGTSLLDEPLYGFDDEEINKTGKRQTVFEVLAEAVRVGDCTPEEVADEFNNTISPGMDTGYTQLCSFMLLMAMHKECQDKLWKEIKEVYKDDMDAEVTTEHFSKMPYLDMCLKETMRLFPTGPVQLRYLHSDFYLKSRDITLPAGATIIFCNYLLHKNPKYWKQPNSFIPERFLPEESAKRPHFAYVPFSAGQRNCIGQLFGMDVWKTAAIYTIRNFELYSDQKIETLPVKADISLRSAVGYNMKVMRRNRNA